MKNINLDASEKYCPHCGHKNDLADFYRTKTERDGYTKLCKKHHQATLQAKRQVKQGKK